MFYLFNKNILKICYLRKGAEGDGVKNEVVEVGSISVLFTIETIPIKDR